MRKEAPQIIQENTQEKILNLSKTTLSTCSKTSHNKQLWGNETYGFLSF